MESRIAGTVAHSFDFDGMLASTKYTTKLKSLILAAATEDRALDMKDYYQLANYMCDEYKVLFDRHFTHNEAAEHLVYVGSDRNDYKTDLDNGFKSLKGLHVTLSCMPFFTALTQVLREKYPKTKITLADLLLEDIYRQLPPGTSFKNISNAWLSLDKSFYKKLAAQLENYDSDESHKLFMELRKLIGDPNAKAATRNSLPRSDERVEVTEALQELLLGKTVTAQPTKNSPQSPRLPKYKDSGKLLIIITQILDAHARQSKGKLFIDYHLADDRGDILNHANLSLTALKAMHNSQTERKALFMKPKTLSQPNEIPTTVLSLIPDTTHVFLEQFIPPEEKEKLQEADPYRFGDFKQSVEIIGTGKAVKSIKDIFSDIQGTHSHLNKQADDDPVQAALIQTVENNAQKKALAIIIHCINELKKCQPNSKFETDSAYRAIRKISKILEKHATGETIKPIEALLTEIQLIGAAIMKKNNNSFLEFNRKHPDHAVFFNEMKNLNPKNPRTDSLDSVYFTIKEHTEKMLAGNTLEPGK